MSYCRFLEGDVYAYACDGGVQFWVSGNYDKDLNRLCSTYGEAYRYAKELRNEYGLDVPDYAIEALKEDALEEAARINGKNSAVTELLAENVKLREELADMPKCETCEAMLDCDECLRADASHKERKQLEHQNARLRELIRKVWKCARLLDANRHIDGLRISDELRVECEAEFAELGIEVD